MVCIGVPAKRGQTQDTNGRTQPKMAVLPVTVVVRRVPGVQVPREGEKWKEQRRGGRERGGSGVGCLRGELVGAQGVLSAIRLFYGCSYRYHLSGDNSRDRYIKGS